MVAVIHGPLTLTPVTLPGMARIRVGVRAWNGMAGAENTEDMAGTRNVMWVEIDGKRVRDVMHVEGKWGEGPHFTTIQFYGPAPEFVYVTTDGVEHG